MKKLLQQFNKSAKRAGIAGAATLAMVFGLHADAQANRAPLPQPAALMELAPATVQEAPKVKTVQEAPKVKYAYSQERLDKIEAEMSRTELGTALLAFAAEKNIRIEMSSSKVMDDNPKDRITIKGLNYSTLIRLNGDISSDSEILLTLAHEIRHSWHQHVVDSDTLALTPRNEWLKRRIQEADCFAFEIHFAYEYEKATGKSLSIGDRYPAAGQSTYAGMLGDYSRARAKKDATVGDAYSQLLGKAFVHVNKQGYDKRFTENLSEIWTSAATKSGLRFAYADEMMNPATDAEFVKAMREVATAGLRPGTDPAALTSWLDSDFLGFEKTGGKPSRANMKTFEVAQTRYEEAKLAWKEFIAPKEVAPLPAPVVPQPPAVSPPAPNS